MHDGPPSIDYYFVTCDSKFMRGFERTDDLQGATLRQRARVFLAEACGLGSLYTRVAVWGELDDKRTGSLSRSPITPMELARFKDDMTKVPPEGRYALLAQTIPRDRDKSAESQKVWFDVIPGLTEYPIVRSVAWAARNILAPAKSQWLHAGDLGAGTGALSASLLQQEGQLLPTADRITLVDRVPALLNVAAHRYGTAMEYIQGDVTGLPFADQSFDLLVSGGLVYSLGREHQKPFFSEIGRLLQPGGVYIDGDYTKDPLPEVPNEAIFHLARLLKGNVAQMEIRGDPLAGVNQEEYFKGFGLTFNQQLHSDELSGAEVSLRILQKTE